MDRHKRTLSAPLAICGVLATLMLAYAGAYVCDTDFAVEPFKASLFKLLMQSCFGRLLSFLQKAMSGNVAAVFDGTWRLAFLDARGIC